MQSRRLSWKAVLAFLGAIALVVVVFFVVLAPDRGPAHEWASWVWEVRYQLWPLEDEALLAELHETARDRSREQCTACHGNKSDSELPVHRIHVTSELLRFIACADCHPKVDIASRGATTAVDWVDVGFCKECHSAFPGKTPGSPMEEVDIEDDCTECHHGDLEPVHDEPYLPRGDIAVDECKGCHGARELPWTPAHERADWLDVHGVEALESGEEPCFACHDFGLKFCDECHAEKPPSHLPVEPWKEGHISAAQKDTRVCYTCHETGHCKNCHVNHEEGWLESHSAYVSERGDDSCTECHSPSACSFCHNATEEEQL